MAASVSRSAQTPVAPLHLDDDSHPLGHFPFALKVGQQAVKPLGLVGRFGGDHDGSESGPDGCRQVGLSVVSVVYAHAHPNATARQLCHGDGARHELPRRAPPRPVYERRHVQAEDVGVSAHRRQCLRGIVRRQEEDGASERARCKRGEGGLGGEVVAAVHPGAGHGDQRLAFPAANFPHWPSLGLGATRRRRDLQRQVAKYDAEQDGGQTQAPGRQLQRRPRSGQQAQCGDERAQHDRRGPRALRQLDALHSRVRQLTKNGARRSGRCGG